MLEEDDDDDDEEEEEEVDEEDQDEEEVDDQNQSEEGEQKEEAGEIVGSLPSRSALVVQVGEKREEPQAFMRRRRLLGSAPVFGCPLPGKVIPPPGLIVHVPPLMAQVNGGEVEKEAKMAEFHVPCEEIKEQEEGENLGGESVGLDVEKEEVEKEDTEEAKALREERRKKA